VVSFSDFLRICPEIPSWPGLNVLGAALNKEINSEDKFMNKMKTVVAILLSLMVVFSFSPAMAASKDDKQQVATEEPMPAVSAKVNINTADVDELTKIPGIGPKTAEAIVAYRKDKGQFKKVEDLVEVKGIGEKKLEKIRPYVQNI